MAYPGVEALLIPWLTGALEVRACTDLPADLTPEGVLPINRVTRIGGPSDDNSPRFDQPTVSVDSFGVDRTAAQQAAQDVHDALRETLPGSSLTYDGGYAVVTRVITVTAPSWRPWDNTDVRRMGASYRLFIKNHPA